MNIIIGYPRYLPVDHHRYFGDIESTTSDICSDEERHCLSAEGGEGLETLGLREVRMEGGTRDGVGEVGKEVGEESGGTAVRDEENRLREDGSGIFFVRGALSALVGLPTLVLRLFAFGWWVKRECVGKGAEIKEEVDKVDLADLGRDEDVFLRQAGGCSDSVR